jgi:hypothetical protein
MARKGKKGTRKWVSKGESMQLDIIRPLLILWVFACICICSSVSSCFPVGHENPQDDWMPAKMIQNGDVSKMNSAVISFDASVFSLNLERQQKMCKVHPAVGQDQK